MVGRARPREPVRRGSSRRRARLGLFCAGANCTLVDEAYGWDAAGDLHTQRKEGRYLEAFTYDPVDRLVESRLLMRDGTTVDQPLQSFGFDGLGNVCRTMLGSSAMALDHAVGRPSC